MPRDAGVTMPGYRGTRTRYPGNDTRYRGNDARYPGNDARYPGKSARCPGDDALLPGKPRAAVGRWCPPIAASPRDARERVPGYRTRPARSRGGSPYSGAPALIQAIMRRRSASVGIGFVPLLSFAGNWPGGGKPDAGQPAWS